MWIMSLDQAQFRASSGVSLHVGKLYMCKIV